MYIKIKNLPRVIAPSLLFLSIPIAAATLGTAAFAQSALAGDSGMLQQKVAAIKAATAENQQKLHQYTWTENAVITVNGMTRPPKTFTCSYGPDGKVQKVPVDSGTEASAPAGGRFRQRIIQKKTAEMKDYMQQVQGVIALYMPPNPAKLQQAFQNKKVSSEQASGLVNLIFRDYALPGDSMTIGFDTAARKIRSVHVNTYLDNPQDGVTLAVSFSSLPDGTNYPSQTILDAQAKNIHLVNTSSNFRKIN